MHGAQLRSHRMMIGFDLGSYADRLGVNQRTLSRWELKPAHVPADVADQMNRDVDLFLDTRDRIEAQTRGEEATQVAIYRDAANLPHWYENGPWRIYNAAAGLVAIELDLGVRWADIAEARA